jgi:S-adenosyl methyltransferase
MSERPEAPKLDTRHAHSARVYIRAARMAEMTRRVNERMRGPQATMRDPAAISRFFDGLDLLEPGVVQPQQWRPDPAVISPTR